MQYTIVPMTAIKQLVLVLVLVQQLEQLQLEVLERFLLLELVLVLEQLRHNRLHRSRFQQRHSMMMVRCMSHSLELVHCMSCMNCMSELVHSMCCTIHALRVLDDSVLPCSVLACSSCDDQLRRCWSASSLPTRTKYSNVALF